jgi:hypothetical protein
VPCGCGISETEMWVRGVVDMVCGQGLTGQMVDHSEAAGLPGKPDPDPEFPAATTVTP